MDQYLNNRQNEILWSLLANPADNGHLYAYNLQRLVSEFPQSGLLQALFSRSDNEQNISHAAAYFDPKALYALVNFPENLAEITDAQIIQKLNDDAGYALTETVDPLKEDSPGLNIFADADEETHHFITEPEAITDQEHEEPLEVETDKEHHHVEDVVDAADVEQNLTEAGDVINTGHTLHTEHIQEDELATGPATYEEPHMVADAEVQLHPHQPETAEIPVEENGGPEAHAEHIQEDELATKVATYEEPHRVTEEEVQLHSHQPETTEVPVEENGEPEAHAEHIQEDELATKVATYEEPHRVAEEEVQLHGHQSEAVEPLTEESDKEEIDKIDSPAKNTPEDESLTEAESFKLAAPPRGIDDDVYDEIVSIDDISFVNAPKPPVENIEPEEAIVLDEEEVSEITGTIPVVEEKAPADNGLNMNDETEKLIIGNIAATDYFAFDRAVNDKRQTETDEENKPFPVNGMADENANVGLTTAAGNKDVSKYNDDAMPYTFLWWLNKTRIEHAGIYQPFKLDTSQAIRQQGADELQQQYYENIFHLSSMEDLDKTTTKPTVEFDLKRKEDIIIKRFIAEEPHISPPDSAKLDTENKARKSAEDQDEMVTETLARIYIDQMLYHKAIDTYKKLMLKFPEKSRYFASQIEQIERKTN